MVRGANFLKNWVTGAFLVGFYHEFRLMELFFGLGALSRIRVEGGLYYGDFLRIWVREIFKNLGFLKGAFLIMGLFKNFV